LVVSGFELQISLPNWSTIFEIKLGFTITPPFENMVYAPAISSGVTS